MTEPKIIQVRDYEKSLLDICKHFREDWKLPEHQRGYVWKKSQELGWISRVDSDRKPVGVFVTYVTQEDDYKTTWINDGGNRIRCSLKLLGSPGLFGYKPEEAKKVLEDFDMPIQHRVYDSHSMAHTDFQLLNFGGESLTPFEFYGGVLVYMPRWEELFRELLEKVHESVNLGSLRFAKKTNNRTEVHRRLRKNYLILYRHLLKERVELSYVQVGKADITNNTENRTVIEWMLREQLETFSPGRISKEIDRFCRIVEKEIANIEKEWIRVKKGFGEDLEGIGIKDSLYRFLVEAAMWKTHRKVPYEPWRKFLYRVLKYSRGTTKIINPKNPHEYRVLSSGKLNVLYTVCPWLGSDLVEYPKPKTSRSNEQVRPGYDVSHVKPLSLHGEGPTIIEPASANRSRKDKPIGEQKRLPGSSP